MTRTLGVAALLVVATLTSITCRDDSPGVPYPGDTGLVATP